jgi:hypothetical protein
LSPDRTGDRVNPDHGRIQMITSDSRSRSWPYVVHTATVLALMLAGAGAAHGQSRQQGLFIAYETLEMAMNEFSNFAGEIGYRFGPRYQARLTVMEVALTERHLASKWEAGAVEGGNVEGYLRGYEAHVDRFFAGNWYVSAAVGYYEDRYSHTRLDESLTNRTVTVGSGVGYARANLFGVEGLFFNLDLPVRYYFNPIEETRLGESTVRPHVIVPNTWIFVGLKL